MSFNEVLSKLGKILGIVLIFIIGLSVGMDIKGKSAINIVTSPAKRILIWQNRGAENNRIKELISSGRETELIDFWSTYTKDRYISEVIMSSALSHNIPVCLWFAQIKIENDTFNSSAVSKANYDGSHDLGLGQANERTFLNSPSFPGLTRDDLLDPAQNMSVLSQAYANMYHGYDIAGKKRLKTNGGSWDEATFFYNTGPWLTDSSTVKYVSINRLMHIYEMERNYQKAFWEEFSK